MQQAPEKMAIFRQAQSKLFDPAQRFLHYYLSYEEIKYYEEYSAAVDARLSLANIAVGEEFLHEN